MSVLRGFLVPSGGWRLRADLTVQLGVISGRRPRCRGPRKEERKKRISLIPDLQRQCPGFVKGMGTRRAVDNTGRVSKEGRAGKAQRCVGGGHPGETRSPAMTLSPVLVLSL